MRDHARSLVARVHERNRWNRFPTPINTVYPRSLTRPSAALATESLGRDLPRIIFYTVIMQDTPREGRILWVDPTNCVLWSIPPAKIMWFFFTQKLARFFTRSPWLARVIHYDSERARQQTQYRNNY
jgi:hypothetical protein